MVYCIRSRLTYSISGKEKIMRLSRTAIGLLSAQYRSVLKKCFLINAGLFAMVAPAMAENEVDLNYLNSLTPFLTWSEASGADSNTIAVANQSGEGSWYKYVPSGYDYTYTESELMGANVSNTFLIYDTYLNMNYTLPTGDISGDFVGNKLQENSSLINIRLVDDTTYQGNMIGNYNGYFGMIQLQGDNVMQISGQFIDNSVVDKAGNIYSTIIDNLGAGVIFNREGGHNTISNSVFNNNYAVSTGVMKMYGGAIYNGDTNTTTLFPSVLDIYDSDFYNNAASTNGGAIYNGTVDSTISIYASNRDVSFSGNKIGGTFTLDNDNRVIGYTGGTSNAIHNNGVVNLVAMNGRTITFDDAISGNNGIINIVGQGTVVFGNQVSGNVINFKSGTLNLVKSDVLDGGIDADDRLNLQGSGSTLSTIDNYTATYSLGNVSLTNTTYLNLDIDIAENTSDYLNATSASGTSKLLINNINKMTTTDVYSRQFLIADENMRSYISLDDGVSVSGWTVSYSENDGYLTLTNNSWTGLRKAVADSNITSYNLSADEHIAGDLGTMASNLTVSGASTVYGDNHRGILISGYDLTLIGSNNAQTWKEFNGAVIQNSTGLLNVNAVRFENNASESLGGVIQNFSNAENVIHADFIRNYTTEPVMGGSAGVLYNVGKISSLSGNYMDNWSGYYGGAVTNEGSLTGTDLIFSGNSVNNVYSGAPVPEYGTDSYGGAIASVGYGSATRTEITNATFNNNYASSNQGNGYGGAIANYIKNSNPTMVLTDVSFANNAAKTAGGAIWNNGNLFINADAQNVTFTNNVAGISDFIFDTTSSEAFNHITGYNGDGTANDIHNEGVLHLNAGADRTITFNGGISGSNGIIYMNDDSGAGAIVLNGGIAGNALNLNGGSLVLRANGNIGDSTSLTVDAGSGSAVLNTQDNTVRSKTLPSVTLNTDLNYKLDVDLTGSTASADQLVINSATDNNHTIKISDINYIGDMKNYQAKILSGTAAGSSIKLSLDDTLVENSKTSTYVTTLTNQKDILSSASINADDKFYVYNIDQWENRQLQLTEDRTGIKYGWYSTELKNRVNTGEQDNLALLNQSDLYPVKTYNFLAANEVHTDTENVGATLGQVNVIGVANGDQKSTIDLNGHEGFTVANDARLLLQNIKLTGQGENASLNVGLNGQMTLDNTEGANIRISGYDGSLTFNNTNKYQALSGGGISSGRAQIDFSEGSDTSIDYVLFTDHYDLQLAGTSVLNAESIYAVDLNMASGSTLNITDENSSSRIESLVNNGGLINLQNNVISDLTLGFAQMNSALNYALDVNLSNSTADKLLIMSDDVAGNVNIKSLNFLNAETPSEEFKIQVIDDALGNIRLTLDDSITNPEYALGTAVEVTEDEVKKDTNASETYYRKTKTGDAYGHISLAQTATVDDSIQLSQTRVEWLDEQVEKLGDTLKLVNEDDQSGHEDKTFNFDSPDEKYDVTEDLGSTAGHLTINGRRDDEGDRSEIDMNGHQGFEIGDGSSVEINNINMTNSGEDDSLITVDEEGTLVLNDSNIRQKVEVVNNGNLEMNGDTTISGTITGSGNTDMKGDVVVAEDSSISGKVTVTDGSALDVQNNQLGGEDITFKNGSTLELTINAKDDYGSVVADKITVEDGAKLHATLGQGIVSAGEKASLQLLKANNEDFNNFADSFDNNMYHFTKDGKNGAYTISLVKKAEDVSAENGGTLTNREAASAWVDGAPFTGGSVDAAIADQLAGLAQNDGKAFNDALTDLAPADAPLVQTNQVALTNRLFNAVNSYLINDSLGKRGMASGDQLDGVSVWAQAYVGSQELKDRGDFYGLDGDSKGIIIGADKQLNRDVKVGLGYQRDSSSFDNKRRDTDVDTNTFFAYGEYKPTQWFVNGLASYSRSKYDETKKVLGKSYDADYKADAYALQGMTGYEIITPNVDITPQAGLRYNHIKRKGYTDGLKQKVSGKNTDILTAVGGVKFAKDLYGIGCNLFRPEAYLGVTYDLVSDRDNAVVNLSNGSQYTVHGKRLPRLGVEAGAGLTAHVTDNLSANINYIGGFRKDYKEHTGLVGLKYQF